MKRIVYVAVRALMPLAPHSLNAQDLEDVVEAFKRAYEFVGEEIPPGRRVVAVPDGLTGRARELTISFASEVKLPLRGDLWGACGRGRSEPDMCSLEDADVLMGVVRPEILGDEAHVSIIWAYEEVPGHLYSESVRVRLVREDGEWKAVEIVSRSIS